MGHRSVALTWSSVVDDRPDRSSQTGRRHRRNVWCECSSKSTHCSKVHGSYHPRTIGLDSFTRRPVWTRRASHPAPSGRPPRGGAKVTWFRYSCEYLGYSREDSRQLITGSCVAVRSTAIVGARSRGEWLCGESRSRISPTTPNELLLRHAISRSSRRHSCSCSGTHSRNDVCGARRCDVVRLVTCTTGAS